MKIRFVAILVVLLSVTVFAAPSYADTQALGTCLVDSLNGKERKLLAKWIYFAIAAHPEMQEFSNINPGDRTTTDQSVGGLVTRLLVEDCAAKLTAAQKADPLAIQKAFEMVGQVAMQELMANQDVMTAISNYANYADQEKISGLLK